MLVAFCSLLFACCLLFFACYLLLFGHCSLLFAHYLLVFPPNYCEIKLLWAAKEWFDYNETRPQIFFLEISEILLSFFWIVVFNVFSTCKTIFKIDIKSQILPELITILTILQYLSLSNSLRHSANVDMITDVKSKIIISRWHFFANVIFFTTSKIQNDQNKTWEKDLYPRKYVLTTYFKGY